KNAEISSLIEFGQASKIIQIYVDGIAWDGNDRKLNTNNALVVQMDSLLLGLRFLESDVLGIGGHPVADRQNSVMLSKANNAVLLKNYLFFEGKRPAEKKFTSGDYGKRLGYV